MTEQKKEQKVGDIVVFVDPVGTQYNAIVTAWWSANCCNLVYVESDEKKRDDYGRQIGRATSVNRKDPAWMAHGFYFMEPGEDPLPYRPPLSI